MNNGSQITIAAWNGPPEAITCPLFTCAICREPVYACPSPGHKMSGYVIWWEHYELSGDRIDEKTWQQLGPFIVHRPGCMQELVRQVTGLGDPRWIGDGMSRDFGEFADQLAYNASHPFPANDPDHRLVIPGQPPTPEPRRAAT